ncbi:MAG: hypothetical protein D8M56_06210 [Chloroflexi bacterium]|nr:hypothetical protein [Chloroflexota bacterium]
MDAIFQELETSYGNVKTPLAALGGSLNLSDFLRWFLIDSDTQLITGLVRAFRLAFAKHNIQIFQLIDVDDLKDQFNDHDLAQFTRLITFDDWSFILIAYPTKTALSSEQLEHIRLFLSDVRMALYDQNSEKYPGIHSLLITTGVDKFQDVLNIPQKSRIHYVWAFSCIRLIILLNKIIGNEYPNDGSAFRHFFDPQDSIAFSVQEGEKNYLDAVKKKVTP